mmetsp:Transcript_4871/g.14626  ORF Transcript_4871/g.14626 Transcript_4871/m.14626 type:complete len:262 (-) Transcript_4871:28-813(-)
MLSSPASTAECSARTWSVCACPWSAASCSGEPRWSASTLGSAWARTNAKAMSRSPSEHAKCNGIRPLPSHVDTGASRSSNICTSLNWPAALISSNQSPSLSMSSGFKSPASSGDIRNVELARVVSSASRMTDSLRRRLRDLVTMGRTMQLEGRAAYRRMPSLRSSCCDFHLLMDSRRRCWRIFSALVCSPKSSPCSAALARMRAGSEMLSFRNTSTARLTCIRWLCSKVAPTTLRMSKFEICQRGRRQVCPSAVFSVGECS